MLPAQLVSWLSIAVLCLACAMSLAYLGRTMTGRLREQSHALEHARHRNLKYDYLVRVGFLAAGAAHEMSSPLSTMSVLVKEMLQRRDDPEVHAQNLRIMADQIEACRSILSELISYGQDVLASSGSSEPVDRFLRQVVAKWELLRPGVKLSCQWAGTQPPPMIIAERGLGHAIVNLLNNAADASPEAVQMNCRWNAEELQISILDQGSGIAPELLDVLGEQRLTTKNDKGYGIGLLLTKTAVEEAGGILKLSNRIGGGVLAEVILPLHRTRIGSLLGVRRKKLFNILGG